MVPFRAALRVSLLLVCGCTAAPSEQPAPDDKPEAGSGGKPADSPGGRGGSPTAGGSAAGSAAGATGTQPDAATAGHQGDRDAGRSDVDAPSPRDAAPSPRDAGGPVPIASPGCTAANPLPEGEATIMVGGAARPYIVRLPTGYPGDKPWPLVLGLHSNGGTAKYWDNPTGARPLRPVFQPHAILVLAQARTGDWRDDLPADVAYFDALIALVKQRLCVDTTRVFSLGFSGGGSFSGVLGCVRNDIRAIATAGAVTYFQPADCVGKPAAWISIGMQETNSARTGFRDFWRDRNRCTMATSAVAPSPCAAYACPDPAWPVHFCSHAGGHEWPAFASQGAWDFFARF